MDAAGGNQVNLTNNPFDDRRPDWSSGGKQIIFARFQTGNWDIRVMNADGSDPKQLTSDTADDSYPNW
jgi:Tol biopolymer transport system component